MSGGDVIGVGIIGMGFMGRVHARTYLDAATLGHTCELRAVCDPAFALPQSSTPSTTTGNINAVADALDALLARPSLKRFTRVVDLLADDSIHAVSICTHTPAHVPLAKSALAAGKHVLLEKPVALTSHEAHDMADVAEIARRRRGLICMPAMCMRFWPAWEWLRDRVHDARFGTLRSLTLQRLGAGPSWSTDFYADFSKSGGAHFDLHVHDVDFIYWCLGRPSRVLSTGTLAHVTTLYHYEGGPPLVTAEGAWDLAPSAGFRMKYLANFERATAEFVLGAAPQLVLHDAGGTTEVPLSPLMGYDFQTRHFIDLITGKTARPRATMREAAEVLEVLEAEAAQLG
jgi:predicted dehydrogenase